MAARKPKMPITPDQQAMLAGQWQKSLPLAADDPFLGEHGVAEGLARMPPDTKCGDHDVSGWVTAQLINQQGLIGLAHLPGNDESTCYRQAVYVPKGWPQGWTVIGEVPDGRSAVVLCEMLADAWYVQRRATMPITCVIYWRRNNLEWTVKGLAGNGLALLVDPIMAAEQVDFLNGVDWRLVTRIDVEYSPRLALEWDVNIIGPVDEWAAEYCTTELPRAPSDGAVLTDLDDAGFCAWSLPDLERDIHLLYGTDYVWDGRNRVQMRLSALRHAIGKLLYDHWIASPARKTARGITFDPTETCGRSWINIFEGLPQFDDTPMRGCRLILEHVKRLCSGREEEYKWLLRWMAYPLQHPGAKMDTAVVVMGAEGTGKSLFWQKIYGALFGPYARQIGQSELEATFNGWMSQLLFAICEEVVSREEMRHHKGKLKNLITSSTLNINEKNLPMRTEPNHINFVFMSNEAIPMILDEGDRRYFVIKTNDVPDAAYFDALRDEAENGGLAAFATYLGRLPMEGFNPHTKPPLNEEKARLIEVGLPNTVLFYREWCKGVLDWPYCSCVRSDLFKAYLAWCAQTREYARQDKVFFNDLLNQGLIACTKDIRYPMLTNSRVSKRLWLVPEDARAVELKDPDAINNIQKSASHFASLFNTESRNGYL